MNDNTCFMKTIQPIVDIQKNVSTRSKFYFSCFYRYQEGYLEELSTHFYLDTALLKSSESVLSETEIFNIKMVDTHFKSEQNQFLHLDTKKIFSAPLYILLGVCLC